MKKFECNFVKENMLLYIYDEIYDKKTKKAIKEHLTICKKCFNEYQENLKIKSIVQEINIKFPDELNKIYINEIADNLEKKDNLFFKFLKNNFKMRKKLKNAFIIIFLFVFSFVGIIYHKHKQDEKIREKQLIEKMDLIENIEILERLEFYKKIYEVGN